MLDNKIPPQNLDAEKSLICAILRDNSDIDDIDLQPGDFYNTKHQKTFSAIQSVINKNGKADLVTVSQELLKRKQLSEVGASYLSQIIDFPLAHNPKSYAKIIKDKAIERSIIGISYEIIKDCHDDSLETVEILDKAQRDIVNIGYDDDKKHYAAWNYALEENMYHLQDLVDNKKKVTGVPSGISKLDVLTGGFQKSDLIILAARPAMGKELTNDSDVLLYDGTFKKMEHIVVGEKVASIDGKKSIVTDIFPQGLKPVYKLTFSDGRSVLAGLDHQWEIMYRDWDKPKIYTTQKLIDKLKYVRYQNRLYIPNHSGNFGIDKDILIHPYLLGVLLGDGGLSGGSIKITSSYDHILEKIKPMLLNAELRKDQKITYRISTDRGVKNEILDTIKKMGLFGSRSYEKFIPKQYLAASRETRIELIRGLIDTDGTVEKNGAMTYSTSSKQLALDFQKLARSLGSYASMTSRIPTYSYKNQKKNGKRSYTVFISCKHYSEFVTIPHKKNRTKTMKGVRNLNVKSIEFVKYDVCQCISVSHDRELYLTDDYITTHNTALALNILHNIVSTGGSAAFFSLEMPKRQLINRILSRVTRYNSHRFNIGAFNSSEMKVIHDACGAMYDNQLHINDNSDSTVSYIRKEARKYKKLYNIQIAVVDYIQIIKSEKDMKFFNREQAVSYISSNLKSMARELQIPVIALAQLNRQLETRPDKKPMLSDLRESGAIEQDADIVTFLYREVVYNKDTPDPDGAELSIAKHRNGMTGTIGLKFQKELTHFYEDKTYTI